MTIPSDLPAFTEAMRYQYSLTPDSVIIEAGTHRGRWCQAMAEMHRCRIYTFEPIQEFYVEAARHLARLPNVVISQCGLANSNRLETWHIKGDMTGAFNGEGLEEEVVLIDFAEWFHKMSGKLPVAIDLLEINIEGGEYELLEAIIAHGLQHRFKNIQVQFHGVGLTPTERRRGIQESLSKTHHLTYHAEWVWENWTLNT